MYEELISELRSQICKNNCFDCVYMKTGCTPKLCEQAADAIEELLKAAKAMHTWIFLNTGDEQKAYDECGLSDEMNAALGYDGGQFVAELPKEEK